MASRLVVFCGIAGRHRAGISHPPMADYPLNHFTAEELRDLRRDPVFHLAIGQVPTVETLDALEAALDEGGQKAESAVAQAMVDDERAGAETGGRQPSRKRAARG